MRTAPDAHRRRPGPGGGAHGSRLLRPVRSGAPLHPLLPAGPSPARLLLLGRLVDAIGPLRAEFDTRVRRSAESFANDPEMVPGSTGLGWRPSTAPGRTPALPLRREAGHDHQDSGQASQPSQHDDQAATPRWATCSSQSRSDEDGQPFEVFGFLGKGRVVPARRYRDWCAGSSPCTCAGARRSRKSSTSVPGHRRDAAVLQPPAGR